LTLYTDICNFITRAMYT